MYSPPFSLTLTVQREAWSLSTAPQHTHTHTWIVGSSPPKHNYFVLNSMVFLPTQPCHPVPDPFKGPVNWKTTSPMCQGSIDLHKQQVLWRHGTHKSMVYSPQLQIRRSREESTGACALQTQNVKMYTKTDHSPAAPKLPHSAGPLAASTVSSASSQSR